MTAAHRSSVQPNGARSQVARAAESRERLMQAAVELFAENGYEATSAGAIADRAGYARSMVNARYGSKDGLLAAMLKEQWVTQLLTGIAGADDGLGGLLSVLDRLGSFIIDQPVQLRAFLVVSFEAVGSSTIPKQQVTALLSLLDAAIAGALRAGVDDGSVRFGIDPGYEAARIIDTGLGMAYRWVVDPQGYDFAAHVGVWRQNMRTTIGATAPSGPPPVGE